MDSQGLAQTQQLQMEQAQTQQDQMVLEQFGIEVDSQRTQAAVDAMTGTLHQANGMHVARRGADGTHAVLQDHKMNIVRGPNGVTAVGTLDVYTVEKKSFLGIFAVTAREKRGAIAIAVDSNQGNLNLRVANPLRGREKYIGNRGKLGLSPDQVNGVNEYLASLGGALGVGKIEVDHPELTGSEESKLIDPRDLASDQLGAEVPVVVRNTVRAAEGVELENAIAKTANQATRAADITRASGGDAISAAKQTVDAVAAGAGVNPNLLGIKEVNGKIVVTGGSALEVAARRADELARSQRTNVAPVPVASAVHVEPNAAVTVKPVPAPTPIAGNRSSIPV